MSKLMKQLVVSLMIGAAVFGAALAIGEAVAQHITATESNIGVTMRNAATINK